MGKQKMKKKEVLNESRTEKRIIKMGIMRDFINSQFPNIWEYWYIIWSRAMLRIY